MKRCTELSVEQILKEKCISIGTIPKEIAEFITTKKPDLHIDTTSEISFWDNRITHTENHKDDFMSDIMYDDCFRSIPDFIKNPDVISIKKDNSSISFIKRLTQDISVVVRITNKGTYSYRTMYPLMSAQLDKYLADGTAWEYPKNDIDSENE
ncbi:PBECR2 nuclease fold domain-containing protein [Butyrivibrio sp. WCD3002]|uniref:PBECR2 nuclease fold domain-containing protein n=1 Tax=Butyrivibrio sp. WCD3002 TaxID=1280676 RepID=UPI0004200F18|nr:PBECR2 nuclease fold domain-containing protein [Butyrivibrio sp. WCD3002]